MSMLNITVIITVLIYLLNPDHSNVMHEEIRLLQNFPTYPEILVLSDKISLYDHLDDHSILIV